MLRRPPPRNGRPLAFLGRIVALTATIGLPRPLIGQCQYEVVQLDYPITCGLGSVITRGVGLNNQGAVVGSYQCATWKHTEAFLWTPEGGFVTIPRPSGVCSAGAADISDSGVIVGTSAPICSPERGFVYEDGLWTTLLPAIPSAATRSTAAAVNETSAVVGERSVADTSTPYTAYSWTAKNGFNDLGTTYGPYASARDVNNSGQIVGSVGAFLDDEAFIWDSEGILFLGSIPNGFSSTAIAINESGDVTGLGGMDLPSGETVTRGFLWAGGEMTIIEPVPGYDTSTARSLNDARQVAGDGRKLANSDDRRAFVWQAGTTHDLNDLVPAGTPLLDRGWAVNEQGQILANGGLHTFLLTPTDRPLGDLDLDCTVGIVDLLGLLATWGPCPPQVECAADVDNDGTVGVVDLLVLLANWG